MVGRAAKVIIDEVVDGDLSKCGAGLGSLIAGGEEQGKNNNVVAFRFEI